jgi:hypothetical protein
MKTLFSLALAASLGLNAAIAYLLLKGSATDNAATTASLTAGATKIAATPGGPETWSHLQTDDLAQEIKRLEASGFPPNVIRAIIAAHIHEQYAARMKALSPDNLDRPFWKNSSSYDPATMAAMRQLYKEQEKAIKDLLGPDPDESENQSYNRTSLSFLPADKADAVRDLIAQFDEKRSAAFSSGFFDQAKYAALEKEQHDALASVLTPSELLDYDLRNSTTARTLRDRLLAFDPSEAEFRAIYQLQAAFDEKYRGLNMVPGASQQDMRARMDAEKELSNQIKAVLTPDRSAIYDRMTDYNYVRTSQLVARLDLPATTTDQLYAVQKEFEDKRRTMFSSGPTSRDQMIEQLTAMKKDATDRLAPLLGNPANVEVYKQYGGSWLQMFNPPTPRPRPPGAVGSPTGGG